MQDSRGAADVSTTTTTEVSVEGANCPWCFNEALDALRRHPGVMAAHGSIAAQCMRIDHSGVDVDQLVTLLRHHLHADDESSGQHVMVAVDPEVANLRCSHGRSPTDSRPGERRA